jgi:hypothetical protein
MSVPKNRATFKEWCLRKLGKPVLEVNLDEDQIDDRIDEALQYYYDYHFDGSEKIYYKYKITAQDIINQYITMPDNITGVVDLFPIGTSLGSGVDNMFNIRYQIALNDLYTLTSVSMVPYVMTMTHLQNLEQLLVGRQPLRYNRNVNILYIDTGWDLFSVGDFIVVAAYQVINPDVYVRAWRDILLQRYAVCLIKEQWGSNMTKWKDMPMPGGMKFNADKIYDDAVREREKLESEIATSWSMPATDMIG